MFIYISGVERYRHPWFAGLLERMPPKKAAVALANKLARIGWAVQAWPPGHRRRRREAGCVSSMFDNLGVEVP